MIILVFATPGLHLSGYGCKQQKNRKQTSSVFTLGFGYENVGLALQW
jgi:hypothetical protein